MAATLVLTPSFEADFRASSYPILSIQALQQSTLLTECGTLSVWHHVPSSMSREGSTRVA
jgi:hypothetical protein